MTWLPFDLHPEYPPGGLPREQLHARYGDAFHDRLKRSFEAAGLAYNPPADVVPRTLGALALTELARDRGLHRPLHDRLMDAYWRDGRDIGDPDVLRELAAEVGLAAPELDAALDDPGLVGRVRASTARAQRAGVTGVPAFVLDGRLLVLGAQPRDVFEQALARLPGRHEGPERSRASGPRDPRGKDSRA